MNFQVRHRSGETGVSVTRALITGPDRLLTLVQTNEGSKVAAGRVGDMRALGLKVVPVPLDHDPGHAEIQSDNASLESELVRKQVARLFRFVTG
jgi:hypothetical protein